jgi:hypothetical protein
MKRVIYIGKSVDIPDNSFIINIPTVHLRNHLFDSLKDYAESSPNPIIFIPDSRILTPDSVRQFLSFLRIYSFVNVIACARQEEDVPYLFKYVLTPIFQKVTDTETPIHKIALELTNDTKYVELVAELSDLGFFTNPTHMYARVME